MTQSVFLIVDDQKSIVQLLQKNLEKISPIPVLTCHSLSEVKQTIANPELKIEVCLCDLNLPDAPKGETIELLNQHQITAVVLSGTFNETTRQEMLKKQVADFVLKDSPASIDYAIEVMLNIYRNAQREILLLSSSKSTYRNFLEALVKRHRYQVKTTDQFPKVDSLDDKKLPSMIIIEDSSLLGNSQVMSFLSAVRQTFDSHQLPIMACEPKPNLANAIKMMKYGVNDFFNSQATPEEIHVRIRQNIELSESYKAVEFLSQIDPLTELYNRRHFVKMGEDRFQQCKLNQTPFFTIMVDIDHFKSVNDSYGHPKGDEVIRYTAQMIQAIFNTEIVGRFGGEEFCIFGCSDDSPSIAETITQKTNLLLKTIETQSDIDTGIAFTLSAGVCFQGEDIFQAINFADKALYFSKENGRNQVNACK